MKKPIATFPGSPPALGPYSLGVIGQGAFLFVSGMTPFDPSSGKIESGPIARQTELVLENIKRVLAAGGASLDDVISCRVYLSRPDAREFQRDERGLRSILRQSEARPCDRRSRTLGI